MSPNSFELNKIAGALLLAGVIAMVSGLIANGLYYGSIAGEPHVVGEEVKRGYQIEVTEDTGAGGEATAADAGPVDIAPFMAKADVEAGKALIKKCTSCHTFDAGGKNGVGPNQFGLVGSPIAHKSDFAYSDALKALHGKKTWTPQELSDFLNNPKKYAPGNKMAFAGMKKPEDRANLIAYLQTLK